MVAGAPPFPGVGFRLPSTLDFFRSVEYPQVFFPIVSVGV